MQMNMPVYPEWLTFDSIVNNTRYAIAHPIASIESYTSYLWNNVITTNSADQGIKAWIYNSFIVTSEALWGYFNQVAKYVVDGADTETSLDADSVRVEDVVVEGVETNAA